MSQDQQHDHDLVSVHSCANDGEADIIMGLLKSNDIEALRESNMPHLIYPTNADAQVIVNKEDEAEALRIIREHHEASTGDDPDEGAQEGGAED